MSNEEKCKDEKVINLMRFAYDILRYSALKFRVQSQSIAAWIGPENDYGCSDFISVVSRLVLAHQINMRHQLNTFFFNIYFEPFMSNSLEHISELCERLIQTIIADPTQGIITKVELSLTAVCEFILFLYSKNSNLFLVQLAEILFRCYLNPNRAIFKRKGGLQEMYRKGKERQKEVPDALINTFIIAFCANYRDSLGVDLEEKYFASVRVYKRKNFEEHTKEGEDPRSEINLPHYKYLVFDLPLTSVQDEDLGVDLPPNPLLGVAPPSEMYDFPLAGAASISHNLPEESVQKLSKRTKKPSYQDRMRNKRHGPRSSVEQGHGQLSSDSSLATGSKQSYRHPGARPKDRVQNTGSSGLRTGESRLYLGVEQGLGQLSLDSSGKKRYIEGKSITSLAKYSPPSDNLLESSIPAKNTRGDLDTNVSNLGSSGKQDIEELSLDSLMVEQSSKKRSDILAADDLTSQNYLDEFRQEHSESSSEEETEEKEIQE